MKNAWKVWGQCSGLQEKVTEASRMLASEGIRTPTQSPVEVWGGEGTEKLGWNPVS